MRASVFSYVVQLLGKIFFWQPIQCQSPALAADGSVCPNIKGVGLGHLGADDLQEMATRKDYDTLQWLSRLPDSLGG